MLVLGMTSMGSTFTSVRSLRYVIYPVQVGLAFVLVRQMYTEYIGRLWVVYSKRDTRNAGRWLNRRPIQP